jgi:hypothetical protein
VGGGVEGRGARVVRHQRNCMTGGATVYVSVAVTFSAATEAERAAEQELYDISTAAEQEGLLCDGGR